MFGNRYYTGCPHPMDMDVKQLPPPQVETTQAFLLGSNCPAIPPVGVLLVPFLWAIRGTQFWAKAFPRFVTHQFKENGNAQYNQLAGLVHIPWAPVPP
jgi:hypothetical protein